MSAQMGGERPAKTDIKTSDILPALYLWIFGE
jgi:hypothetical protein